MEGVKGVKGMQVWILLVNCSIVIRDVILTEHDPSSLDGVETLPDLKFTCRVCKRIKDDSIQ